MAVEITRLIPVGNVRPLGYLKLANAVNHSQPRIFPRADVSRGIDTAIDLGSKTDYQYVIT
jgi:hypothetical protein